MQINGFEIEKFNIHNIPEGVKYHTCPLCSESRKKKTQKCLSVFWDKGIAFCSHCGGVVQLHEWKKKDKQEDYKIPEWQNNTNLSDKLIKWFEGRGISQFVLRLMKISEGIENMPDKKTNTWKEKNTVQFPYFRYNDVVNVKYRTGSKEFKLYRDAEKIPYNLDRIIGQEIIYAVEGECFDKDAEILTDSGWKLFSELNKNDLVAEVLIDKSINFVKPNSYIKKKYDDKLVVYKNKRNNYYSSTTKRHNIVTETRKGLINKIEADKINSYQYNIPRSGYFDGNGIYYSDDYIRLLVAISADFTIRKGGDIYGAFKKNRKIVRICKILDNLNIIYKKTKVSNGYTSIFIHRGHNIDAFKIFPFSWISKLSRHQIEIILDEIILWDGNSVKGRTMKEYNSKELNNIIFIQTLCHLSGRMSTIVKRKNKYGEWYKCSILQKNKSILSKYYKQYVDYNDYVYCVTVESGMILVKQNNNITISGNCDVLAVMECGIFNVTSPPNGFTLKGNVNIDWLNNDVEHFINAKKIVLCFDNDIPGENGKREFIRRFGAHKCYTVDLKGEKDANDFLVKHGKDELRKTLENHIEIPLENVSTYNDFKEDVRDFFLNGMPKGYQTGNLFQLDENFSVQTSHIVLVTGIPTSGKSEVVDQITVGYSIKHKIDTAYASVENKPNSLHLSKLVRKINGITPRSRQDFNDSFIEVEKYVDKHFHFIDLEGSYDLERVLMKAEELVYRKGIKCLVIDPFNKVQYKGEVPSITGNKTNDYTNKYLSLLNEFAVKLDIIIYLVAHPIKMNKMENGKRAIPDFYDVKGGGEFYDMCHHGLVVHRDYNLDLTLIKVLKCKFAHLGTNQAETWFKYNASNGRLSDISGIVDEPESVNFKHDNSNWITKNYNDNTQQEMFDNNDDLKNISNEWYNQENRELDEAPF